ncbi:DUF4440 domain-containing protein [Kineococcus sp. DHX-1]|uniref:DUF4440 domain-containing protein n=1 Tax=Kineococcus sp. DHX-1 TaxID=3349638 RepID=UPI0036D24727
MADVEPVKLPVPRLLDPATVSERAATTCFDAVVNSHRRRAPLDDEVPRSRTPAPEGLRAVFAAHVPGEPTPVAHATAFRAPGRDRTYLAYGHRSSRSRSWFAASLTAPSQRAAATWDRFEPSGHPDGGIAHFFGHADPTVIAVMLRTPDGTEHFAPTAAGLWWTAVWLDVTAERTIERTSWRAVAADGEVAAEGTGPLGQTIRRSEPGRSESGSGRPAASPSKPHDEEPAGATDGSTWPPPTDPDVVPVLRELQAREPLLHRPTPRPETGDPHPYLAADFVAVGPTGRRHDRRSVVAVLSRRRAARELQTWQADDFHCRALGQDTFLVTYELRRGGRTSHRMTLWRRAAQGWEAVYHQATAVRTTRPR